MRDRFVISFGVMGEILLNENARQSKEIIGNASNLTTRRTSLRPGDEHVVSKAANRTILKRKLISIFVFILIP